MANRSVELFARGLILNRKRESHMYDFTKHAGVIRASSRRQAGISDQSRHEDSLANQNVTQPASPQPQPASQPQPGGLVDQSVEQPASGGSPPDRPQGNP